MRQSFEDLKIGTKLVIGFGVAGILLVFGTLAGLGAAWMFKGQIENLYRDYLVPEQQVRAVVESVYRIQSAVEGSQTSRLSATQAGGALASERTAVQALMSKMVSDAGVDAKAAALQTVWLHYQSALNQVEVDVKTGESARLLANMKDGEFAAAQSNLLQAVDEWRQEQARVEGDFLANSQAQFTWIAVFLIGAGLIGILISQVVGYLVTHSILRPLKIISIQMDRLSSGKTIESHSILAELNRRDEMGGLVRRLAQVDEYFRSVTFMADQVSSGDLSVHIQPRSQEDLLSISLTGMLDQLSGLVMQVAESSRQVEEASRQLVDAASQSDQATGHISTTIQQVAAGLNRQRDEVNRTMTVIQRTTQAVDQVARGASEQERTVVQTTREAEQMAVAIDQVTGNAKSVVWAAQEASKKAGEGSNTLRQTVESMELIRRQVSDLSEKMNTVNSRSEEIGSIIETIDEIATKTNILAINATIEAAHAEVQARKLTEDVLSQMMISQCQMVNELFKAGAVTETGEYWDRLCHLVGLDMILATDEDGVTTICNDPKLLGFRFSDDPKAQTYPFRQLIHQKNGVFCQDAQARSFDSRVFKYVGVSRADQPGIIQVGYDMSSIKKFDLRINGFAVVAGEVYHLAERARESTREIRDLVKGIQISITEAVVAMRQSRKEVETGMQHAGSAGGVLKEILESVQSVSQQALSALTAAGAMERLSRSLAEEIQAINRVVQGNHTAVAELNNGYGVMARTMENTAGLSAENSAAAQQVSASAAEMRVQVKEVTSAAETLERMSVELNTMVDLFHLNTGEDFENSPVVEEAPAWR
jgi:methyl-accepting chemotaxis protein